MWIPNWAGVIQDHSISIQLTSVQLLDVQSVVTCNDQFKFSQSSGKDFMRDVCSLNVIFSYL